LPGKIRVGSEDETAIDLATRIQKQTNRLFNRFDLACCHWRAAKTAQFGGKIDPNRSPFPSPPSGFFPGCGNQRQKTALISDVKHAWAVK